MGSQYPPPQPYYMPPMPPYERPPSWFQRNKKMAIVGGCALVTFVLLLVLGFVAVIAFGVMSLVKSSNAYTEALSLARQNEEVRTALGEPIEDGWFVTGSVQSSGSSGEASLVIPLNGPKDEGTLYVEGRKSAGAWHYSTMELEVKSTRQRIRLLRGLPRGGEHSPQIEVPPTEPTPDEPPAESPQ